MHLVVENGSGLVDANSYVSTDDVGRGLPSADRLTWQALSADEQIDKCIIASRFIDSSFPWVGTQKTIEQSMSWPRVNVFFQGHRIADAKVPAQVKRATIMAAGILLRNGMEIFLTSGESKEIKRERFAVMETEYFEPHTNKGDATNYPEINNLLRGFYSKLKGNMLIGEVVRV